MPWTSVLPSPPPSPSISPTRGDPTTDAGRRQLDKAAYPVYILEASCKLPTINADRTVKSIVFRNPRRLKQFTQWTWRSKRVLNACFALGCVATWLFGFVDLESSHALGLVALALLFCPTMVGFLVMRYDVAKLLMTTYEFWYVTVNLAVNTVLLVLYLRDVYRSPLVVMTFLCYINTFLVDATYTDVKTTTISLALGAFSVFVFLSSVALQTIPETHTVVLFAYNQWTLDARDVILNNLGIALLLASRNSYRKYAYAPKPREDGGITAFVRLTGYRVTVRFVRRMASLNSQTANEELHTTALPPAVSTASSMASSTFDGSQSVASQSSFSGLKRSQLMFVSPPIAFPARDVLVRPALSCVPSNPKSSTLLTVFALCTYVLNITTKCLEWNEPRTQQLAIVALLFSFVYCGLCFAALNRRMLLLLLRSFDVLFLFVQFLTELLTTAYLLRWNLQCLMLITSWLWLLWLLTTDALTPVMKHRLGVSKLLLITVLLGQLLEQILLVVELIIHGNLHIQDRVVFSITLTARHSLVVRAIPFLFTRMFSTFWWTWRLLWRVCWQDASDLIVIQGAVEYEDYALLQRLRKRKAKQLLRSQQTVAVLRQAHT